MYGEAGASGECHQSIETKLADMAAQQIVQARLRYRETPCSLGLGYSPSRHGLARQHADTASVPEVGSSRSPPFTSYTRLIAHAILGSPVRAR